MQRVCLAFLQFCLSAWAGIAIFFVTVVVGLRQSDLFAPEVKFNHPKVLFPLYYSFEFALLGTALVCMLAGLGNPRLGRVRRLVLFGLVAAAVATAVADYAFVYQPLVAMMMSQSLPAGFDTLHRASRWLNAGILGLTLVAACLSLMSTGAIEQGNRP